jgi:hypothetical protein
MNLIRNFFCDKPAGDWRRQRKVTSCEQYGPESCGNVIGCSARGVSVKRKNVMQKITAESLPHIFRQNPVQLFRLERF